LKNTALVLVIVLLCGGFLEVMTRLFLDSGTLYELEMWKYARLVKMRDYRADIGHRHRPNAHAELMAEDVRTNSQGFRGPEIAEKAADGVARIAFLGDSLAMGWGVAQDKTFPQQVVAELQKAGRKVDGFNMGVGNYNTTQELALYKDTGAKMKPDIIVLGYFINDAEPIPSYSDTGWLENHSEAWVVLKYRIDSVLRQTGDVPDWKRYYRELYNDDRPGWAATKKALGDLAALAKTSGIKLVVFHLPELHELKPYPFNDVTAKVRSVVEATGVPFVDLLPSVENLDPPSLWVTVPDPHPNARADTALSQGMVKTLLPMLDQLCSSEKKGC
jgi:hypothetical protein